VATGSYEEGMAYFSRASGIAELVSLAYSLEEGNRVFYADVASDTGDEEGGALFRSLVLAEEHHKETLRAFYVRSTGENADPPPPAGVATGSFMEGGIPVAEAISWARNKGPREILDLAIAVEANALDRYVKMGRNVGNDRSREIFLRLAGEERGHLERMTALLDRLQGRD